MPTKLSLGKIILGLLALLILASAGLYFHVTRQVERELVTIASHASPLGTLEWGAIHLHPSGQIHINELRFAPHLLPEEVRIGQLVFTAPNLIELLQATREFDAGRLPRSLGLLIRKLQMPVAGGAVNQLDAAFSTGLPFEAVGCDGRDSLRISDLPDLNIWELMTDISLDYRMIDAGESILIRLSSHSQNLAGLSLELQLYLGTGSRELHLLTRTFSSARLERATLDYRDLGYRERLERFCAEQAGTTVDHFKSAHVNAWSASWAHYGLSPSEELLAAYRQFIADPQTISLVIQPPQRLPLTAFTRMEQAELLDLIDATVSVNDDQRLQVGFGVVARVPLPSAVPEERDETAEPSGPAAVRRITWTEIPHTQAENHLQQRVRITTAAGERIIGELVDTDADYLHLRIRGVGGFHVRPFNRHAVAAVEVRG